MTADRIRRYLDDLGKLSARLGVWIENGGRGTLLHVNAEHAAGYQAWLRPSGGRDSVYEIDSYVRGAALDGDGVIVGDDHSPEGKERRAREWREEYAEAIAELNGRVGPGLLPLPRPSGPPGKNGDLQLAASAIERACRDHGVELRASPEGILLIPARDGWSGFDHCAADHPVGGVLLVERDDG